MNRFRASFLTAVFVLLCALLPKGAFSQGFFEFPPASPFNKLVVKAPDSAWSYTFLTGGHLYGAHENERSIYPASSFLGNVRRMSANPANLFVALGDIMRHSGDPAQIKATATAFSGLEMPVYNAPGNHDLSDRAAYEKAFAMASTNAFLQLPGSMTQVGFFVSDDYYMIMDTEYLLAEGENDPFFSFVEREKKRLKERIPQARNIFVFSHRLVWALCDESLAYADELANEPIAGRMSQEVACRAVEAVTGMPHKGEVYWFSGDVGTHWSVPLLYGYDETHKMHVAASGIGDTPSDAFLKVTVSPEGKVSLGTYALTDQKWNDVKSYTIDYWKNNPSEADQQERFWPQVVDALGGKSFFVSFSIGVILTLVFVGLIRFFSAARKS